MKLVFGKFILKQILKTHLLTVSGVYFLGCSTPVLHPNLKENTRVLVRQWTKPPFLYQSKFDPKVEVFRNAGDRSTEYSNTVLYENVLIYGTQAKGVVCIYPKLDLEKWIFPIKGGVVSEIVVEKGAVYFGGADGFFYAVDLDSGALLWRYEVRNTLISKPVIVAGRVFVTASDDTVYSFDAGTGKWLWHYKRNSSTSASIYAASSPLVDGQNVIVGLSDGFLVALNLQDGALKWERKLHQGSKFVDVDASPVLFENVIYIAAYDGSLYALKRENGETLWRYEAGGSKKVLIDGDRLFLPSSDGSIHALQRNSGKLLWKFNLDMGIPTQIVLTDRYLVFGSSHQYLYAIDRGTGVGLYRLNVGMETGFSGVPAYDEENRSLYFLSHGGNLYKFSVRLPRLKEPKFGFIDGYSDSKTF